MMIWMNSCLEDFTKTTFTDKVFLLVEHYWNDNSIVYHVEDRTGAIMQELMSAKAALIVDEGVNHQDINFQSLAKHIMEMGPLKRDVSVLYASINHQAVEARQRHLGIYACG